MEFPFDVHALFPDRITVIEQSFAAERPHLQEHVSSVIDAVGRASAKAQQLSAPITSAAKLQAQKHQIFLLKDGKSCRDSVIVGFLKVGYKKLFLLDRHGVHVEAQPLCVLDFYVVEKFQRSGYGLELFNYMLEYTKMAPVLMAFDRPSPRLLSFLSKHFDLRATVPQVNNFVVFEDFFLNKTAPPPRKVSAKKVDGDIKPYSSTDREDVHQEHRSLPWPFELPRSPQRSQSLQRPRPVCDGDPPLSRGRTPQGSPCPSLRGDRSQSPLSAQGESCRPRRHSPQGLGAPPPLHGRHGDSTTASRLLPPPPEKQPTSVDNLHLFFSSSFSSSERGAAGGPWCAAGHGYKPRPLPLLCPWSDVTSFKPRPPLCPLRDVTHHKSHPLPLLYPWSDVTSYKPHPPLCPLSDFNSYKPRLLPPLSDVTGREESTQNSGPVVSSGRSWTTGRSWTVGRLSNAKRVRDQEEARSTRPW